MDRKTQRLFSRHVFCALLSAICLCATQSLHAANTATWSASESLVDTTNYAGLAPYWWFANFGAPNPVTGAPMNQNESRNLPSWIHLETRPACIGMADNCTTSDSTIRTGFSFTENPAGVSSNSTGGQPSFNIITLPDGSTGRSGEAVDQVSGVGTTAQMVYLRILEGAPDNFRMYVVTDNGTGTPATTGYHQQIRMRVSLRNTSGPPTFEGGDTEQVDAEALPNGVRIGQTPVGINGIADAWAFRFTDVGLHDVITVRPTSQSGLANHRPAFAGIMIVPEPTSISMLFLGLIGAAAAYRRRRG